MKTLYTRWGKELDPEHVLSEYPRPMMRRKSYVNLNGYWDYRICKEMKRRPLLMRDRSSSRFHRRVRFPE